MEPRCHGSSRLTIIVTLRRRPEGPCERARHSGSSAQGGGRRRLETEGDSGFCIFACQKAPSAPQNFGGAPPPRKAGEEKRGEAFSLLPCLRRSWQKTPWRLLSESALQATLLPGQTPIRIAVFTAMTPVKYLAKECLGRFVRASASGISGFWWCAGRRGRSGRSFVASRGTLPPSAGSGCRRLPG